MYWLENQIIHDHYQNMATSGKDVHWINYVAQEFIKDKSRVLSMGCGEGALERHLTLVTNFLHVDALDLNEQRLKVAKESAYDVKSSVINYLRYDFIEYINSYDGHKYDAIIFNMSLHHSSDPFALLKACKHVIKDDGIIILNEYVGPSRLQVPIFTRKLVEHFIKSKKNDNNFDVLKKYLYPTIDEVISADPTEAIVPEIIPASIDQLFEIAYSQPIATGFLPNVAEYFDFLSPSTAEFLCYLDRLYLDMSFLDADYILYVLKNK